MSVHPSVTFLTKIFLPGDRVCLAAKKTEGTTFSTSFLSLEEACSDETVEKFTAANDDGANIYVCMNPIIEGHNRRRKEDIKDIRSVYLDIDKDGKKKLEAVLSDASVPAPIVLESSTDKFQVIWPIRAITKERQEELLDVLIAKFGGDKAASDCSRVLRLPGYANMKYVDSPVVAILKEGPSTPYSPADFKVEVKPSIEKKPWEVYGVEVDGPEIPHGEHDLSLHSIAGKLRSMGEQWDESAIYNRLFDICEKRVPARGEDWLEMIKKHASRIVEKPAGVPITTLIDGKPPRTDMIQPASPSASAFAAGDVLAQSAGPELIQPIQLEVAEGEQPQWQDIFGIIHDGIMPPSALNDVVEVEGTGPDKASNPQGFAPLLNRKRLKKDLPSWLSLNAEPYDDDDATVDALVESFLIRHGLSILCAKQGSFKSLLLLTLAQAMLEADQNPSKDVFFLGRRVNARPRDSKDKRPLRVYYIDDDGNKSLTKKNCRLVGLGPYIKNGSFVLYGGWQDPEITSFDDQRLMEVAKRERAVIMSDALQNFSEGLNLSDAKDANYIMSKAKKLSRHLENLIIAHHDIKSTKSQGYGGAVPIVSVPDVSYNLVRHEGTDNFVIRDIRVKGFPSFEIHGKLQFNKRVKEDLPSSGIISDNGEVISITYQVTKDTLDPETRKTEQKIKEANADYRKMTPEEKAAKKAKERQVQLEQQKKDDAVLIERAVKAIKEREAGGKPPMSQSALGKELGVKDHKAHKRVFCASTPEDPRPWITCLDSKGRSLLFFSDNKQRNVFEGVDPEFDEKQAAKEKEKQERAAKKKKNAEVAQTNPPARVGEDAAWAGRISLE